jgi:uncharacterized protein with PQ loop repeat
VIEILGLIAALTLPLWNIPLIVKIVRRKSSKDFSLWWTFGVWLTLLVMLPSALVSKDLVFKVFNIANLAIFTAVVYQVVRHYRD